MSRNLDAGLLIPPERPPEQQWMVLAIRSICYAHNELFRLTSGNLTIGDGLSPGQLAGEVISVTTTAADTDVVLDHQLGVVPIGFLVFYPPLSGTVNRGATTWTALQASVRCSAPNQTFRLLLLPPMAQQ